jgi:hypothetical protein
MRYTLITLLAVTSLIAIVVAALRVGDWMWARILFTVVLSVNLGAIVAVIYSTGRRRAFWIGFALFGWTSWSITNVSYFRIAEHQLVAKQVHTLLGKYTPEGNDGLVIDPGGMNVAIYSFRQIIYSTFGLAFSAFGGFVGYWCYRPTASVGHT